MTPRRACIAVFACSLILVPALARGRAETSHGRHRIADRRAEIVFSQLEHTDLRVPGAIAIHPPQPTFGVRPTTAGARPATGGAGGAVTGEAQAPSPGPSSSFAGLADDGHTIPPDTNGAVGPTQVVTALNTHVRVQTRSGGVLSTVTLASFWSALGSTDPFDPRTRYDPYSSRWIMTSAAGASGANPAVLIAVSKTSDATAGWYQWRINSPGGYWADYPTVGFNKNWIVVQANIVSGAESFDHSAIYAFGKSSLYAGGLGSYASFEDAMGATQFPVTTYSSTLNTMYLIENFAGDLGGTGALRISTISGPVGAETYTGGVLYPTVQAPWADSPPGASDTGPQAGTSAKIDLSDARIQSAIWRNGTLWAAHTVFLPSSSPSRAAVQWWQIGSRGDVVQRGRVDDAAGSASFAYPAMAVNRNNDVLLGYSRFSPTSYVSADYALRSGNDALGTIRGNVVLKAGEAPYYKTNGTGENRWGDYSAAAVDPLDDSAMWTLQQYAATSNRWATWWGRAVPPAPSGSPLLSVTPSSLAFDSRLVSTTSAAKQLLVKNAGNAQFVVNGIGKAGANPSDFSIASNPCTGQVLWPGMSCVVDVTFAPTAAGSRSATLSVSSTASGSPFVVTLSGTGITDTRAPVSSFRTETGAISLGLPGQVFGTSTDDYSGVASVSLEFESEFWTERKTAGLTCTSGNLSCSWSAFNPIIPGTYTIRAWATDALGNVESPGPTITITVI